MNINEILDVIYNLSFSQGMYGRIFEDLMYIRDNDECQWCMIVDELERQNFQSSLDLILYIEC